MTRTVITVFRVLPPVLGEWELYRGSRELGRYDDKASAVAEGRRLAQQSVPSRLIVHRSNGEIEDEIAFLDDSLAEPA
ncbi:MAG TPA: DUF2188 domain-containing protein [Jiangellaceae bacterium]|nr:DUF2188 domain-containing protein [Jiangellaceae bacterium]